MPIRGHSNVQGIGSVGVTPKLKDAIFERLQSHFNVQLPKSKGMDTMACMESAYAGRSKFAFCLGGNLWGSNPDATYARDAMAKLDMVVYLNTTLNTGHAWGLAEETIILPSLARDEEPQPTTQESMFSFVRYSDGGPRRHEGPKSEIEVIAHLARAMLGDSGPINWQELEDTKKIRATIARIVPATKSSARLIARSKSFRSKVAPFTSPVSHALGQGEAVHARTPRARRERQSTAAHDDPRSEGQFNTVVYEDYDLYRGVDRRDVVLIHPDDIRRLGFEPEQTIRITSEVGEMEAILRPFEKIRPAIVRCTIPSRTCSCRGGSIRTRRRRRSRMCSWS